MNRYVVIIAALCLAGSAVAEERIPPRVVRVIGTADVKVVPDEAIIEVGVGKQNASASIAKKMADTASRKILAALKAAGLEEKDVQTTYLSLRPQFDYRKGMKISYFVAEQTLTVRVRDLSKLDGLLESLIQAGGNRIDSVEYETSDLRKYRDQARDLAVRAAREKAEALAKAVGQNVGKAYSIEELPEFNYQSTGGLMGNITAEVARAYSPGPSTAAGQKKIAASIIVSFDLN